MTTSDQTPPSPTPDSAPARLRVDPQAARSLDPSVRWALSLVGESKPYEVPAGRQERVWLRLSSGRTRRPRRPRLAMAIAMAAMVGCVLVASAALAGWPGWLARAIGLAPVPASAPAAPPTTPAKAHPATRLVTAPPRPAVEPAAALSPGPAVGEPPAGPAPPRRVVKAVPPEEPGALLEAMRALRVERNPARARRLLTAYLDRHPRGALAEEALVMLVEAAVAHRDRDASALADRYFSLYPKGPFRGQVERTVAAYGPRP